MVRNRLKIKELRERQVQQTIGRRYGHSVVIKFSGRLEDDSDKHRSSVYILQCDCGNIFERKVSALSTSSSCGCKTWKQKSHRRGSYNSYGISSFNELYSSYKNRAKYTNKIFNLTKEQFKEITSKNCRYCGIEPLQKLKTSRVSEQDGIYRFNGIDRLDSSIGYIYNNCVPCCEICNKAKRDLSEESFLSWIDRIIKFRKDGAE